MKISSVAVVLFDEVAGDVRAEWSARDNFWKLDGPVYPRIIKMLASWSDEIREQNHTSAPTRETGEKHA